MDAIPVGALIIGAKLFIIVNGLLVIAAYLVYFERKISAWMQNRIGPNRVGPLGLFQSFADVFKLWTKEDIHNRQARLAEHVAEIWPITGH